MHDTCKARMADEVKSDGVSEQTVQRVNCLLERQYAELIASIKSDNNS